MDNIQQNSNIPKWIRPWNIEKFDSLSNKDERFFSIVIKGALSWLTRNIILYNKPIKHFIYNTGSSIMYVETNGYEMSWKETTGEDQIYMSRPRCIVNIGDISIEQGELSQPGVRGIYEREANYDTGKMMQGFNAELIRIPVMIQMNLTYVLSSFNESIVLTEEILSKIIFQQYFNVVYLGQNIMCSIELPESFHIETNKIDMTSTETNQKNISFSINICCNYPRINELTEIKNDDIIARFNYNLTANKDNLTDNIIDEFSDSSIKLNDMKELYKSGYKIVNKDEQ